MGGSCFWGGTTSNDLDPDFHWTSLRLSRFLIPNLGDLQKKRAPPKLKRFFRPNSSDLIKKRSSSRLKNSFSGPYHLRFQTSSHHTSSHNTIGGAIFVFNAKIGLKSGIKTGYFAYFSRQWGGGARTTPPPPSGYATVYHDVDNKLIVLFWYLRSQSFNVSPFLKTLAPQTSKITTKLLLT